MRKIYSFAWETLTQSSGRVGWDAASLDAGVAPLLSAAGVHIGITPRPPPLVRRGGGGGAAELRPVVLGGGGGMGGTGC